MRERTLLDVLLTAVEETPNQVIVQVDGDAGEQVLTFSELLDAARRVAGGLRSAGLRAGTPVLVLPESAVDFLPSFWGVLAAGLVPVPLAPVADRVAAVWSHLDQPPVLVAPEQAGLAEQLVAARTPGSPALLRLAELRRAEPVHALHRPGPDDVAFLQFSSGSTGAPKGVVLSHANVVANLDQARTAGAVSGSDVMVSWLPYFHDMGLIGAHLTPLSLGVKQVKLAAADFGKRPALWYEVASRHRATLLPMASFALALTVKRVSADEVAALDLSSVRLVGVGAEPIPVPVWRQFLTHLAPAGLRPSALLPVYGLAEATLAVAFPPLGEVAEPLRLDRRALASGEAVDVATGSGPNAGEPAEFLDVGFAVVGGELRVVGDEGAVLADSQAGQIEFCGPNVARGYHQQPDETASAFRDGWVRTGDVGFLRGGRLCVTGRSKDVLFVHGQKFHAHDLEQVATATVGIPPGRVAVVGVTDPVSGVERVCVFVSWREPLTVPTTPALTAVRARVREALGYDDVSVLPIRPEDFPRTTSGKVQRSVLRERLLAGVYAELQAEVEAAAPRARSVPEALGDVESRIIRIWAEVLEVPVASISPDDRFMAIGGSSLAAMHVLGRLEEAFGRTLQPALLRDCATVAALAERLSGRPGTTPAAEVPLTAVAPSVDPPAVIGMACRFPDADTPEAFWDNLAAGRDSVTEVPADRWRPAAGAKARWGGFLADVAGFDAGFFGVDPADAAVLDPHARIFLEVAHEALERAGYAGERRRHRRVGVFVAVGESGYASLLEQALDGGMAVPPSALVGNLRSLIAGRVAQHLDLSGPALVVDTACSSALVALHLARRSLESGECDVAVVGGVSLNLTPTGYRLLESAQALSPTGRSRAFGAGADGFVPGEGAAALVLEPLSVAQAAGDPVLAVVRGSTVNNDGRSLSLMAPNPLLQEAVIADAYRDARIHPAAVSYVEAHGTGTAVGDPIEARSLVRAFGAASGAGVRGLGSVKTNIGHLLNAAGMPSLLKVVLCLVHRALPPSLHYQPSPSFDLAAAGFEVVTVLRDWEADGPLLAGINGFGFGGTNAHVILEEAPPLGASPEDRWPGPQLLTVSAATEPALQVAIRQLADHVRTHPDVDQGDLCHSASTARDAGPHRLALVVDGDLPDRLVRTAGAVSVGTTSRRRPRVAWLFGGQSTQRPGLGRSLQSQPVFRQVLQELSESTGAVRGRSLFAWSVDDVAAAELDQTEVAQPLLVAYEIALAAVLESWGLRPAAVVGHSVGELAALAVAGVLRPAEAVRFAAERGRLMQHRCPAGAMAALVGSAEEVQRVLDAAGGEVSLAAVNGPARVVVSGPEQAVEAVLAGWTAGGRPGLRLAVSRAFHSAGMDPALEQLRQLAATLAPQPEQVPLLSTVDLGWNPLVDADYVAAQARRPVQFAAAVQRLLADGYDTLLTVEPGTALRSLATSVVRAERRSADVAVLSTLDQRTDDRAALLGTVGRLWERGLPLNRPAERPARVRVPVPTYPYQRVPYWLPAPVAQDVPSGPVQRRVSALLHRFGWPQAPLPAGVVLTSVALVGSHPTLVPALADRLARRGVTVHSCPLAQLDELPTVSAIVLFGGPGVELDGVQALDRITRSAAETMPALARFVRRRPSAVVVVTEDAALTGAATERGRPGQAVLTGLARALGQESREHGVRIVDLSSFDDQQVQLDSLVRELDAPPSAGPAESVAWRTGRRLTQVPEPDGVVAADRPSPPPDGCYLITGGTGGVGAALARALAARGSPQLVLLGRAPECADGLLAELEALGASPRYVPADCADADQVDALVATLPRLDGVFHAAGVLGPGLLAAMSERDLMAGCEAKVRGTYLLARALQRTDNRPDVFVSCSSIASALPGYAGGLGAYAAGSAFLDAFAAAEQHSGRPMQVLDFAAWTDTGMAASPAFRTLLDEGGLPQISAERAVEAALDATTVNATQLLVMDTHRPLLDPPPSAVAPVSTPRTPQRVDPSPVPAGTVRELVATLIAAELGLGPDDLDDDASLLSMGLDSLAAVDLVRKLETLLGRELPTTLLFEHPSITQLTAHLTSTAAAGRPAARPRPESSDPFPLSPVQLAFHTSGRLHPEVGAYAFLRQTVSGQLDPRLLARSLARLERRHPMLRVRIRTEGGQPQQAVQPVTPTDWPQWFTSRPFPGSALAGTGPDQALQTVEDELCNEVFDLAAEGPIRAVLLQHDPEHSSLLLLLHHAAADGASLNLLCAELWQVYTALAQHRDPELAPLASTYRDHVELSEHRRAAADLAVDLGYWAERLGTRGPPAPLPVDGDPAGPPAAPLTARQFGLDPDLTRALRARAAAAEVSLFHLVLSGYVSALAGWTGEPQVSVNVARAGREARLVDIGRLVGPFADTLPITVTVDPSRSADLPRAVRSAWRESEQHGMVTSLDLARLLPAAGAAPRTAGTVSFSFARFGIELPVDCPVRIVDTMARTASAATRLSLVCWELDGSLRFSWNYPAHLFAASSIERFSTELLAGLTALGTPDLTEREPLSIAGRIRAQCRRAPEAVAVQDEESRLSYGQLDLAAGQLASRLRTGGVRPDDRVALLTEPGPATVIGLLGILYAGAGWVPLDPHHPPARLRAQLDRADARAVVVHEPTREIAAALGSLPLLEIAARPVTDEEASQLTDPDPDDVAYVIFTSGTTGRAKGVPITHRALTTYLDWAIATFGYRSDDRMLATASICFDASVRQLLAPLLVGATIVTASRDTVRDPRRLLGLVERHAVTVWSSVPTLWELVLRSAERQLARDGSAPDLSALRWVHVGGEALSPVPVRRWFDLFGPQQRVVNLYGPTEATINATYHVVESRPDGSDTRIPIGRPVAATVTDVVDPAGASCSVGQPGELWLAGPGITAGYLDEPELTADAFVERDGLRYYRTGDRVLQRSDGSLDFLGRLDQQVTIRGHRVEPGEVETALRDHPAVAHAAVLAWPAGDAGGQQLVGYLQLTDRRAVSTERLRAHLAARLPDYLVPAQLTVVDELPLTVTGKLDVAGLTARQSVPPGPDDSRLRTPPRTPTEQLVASVWQRLLDVDQVAREDDFFALGGDSIGVLEVFARLEEHVPRLPAPTTLYRHRTLSEFATAISADGDEPSVVVPPGGSADGPYPLSPAQRGFLLSDAWSPDAQSSWLAGFRLTGRLEPAVFQRAVDRLVARHPMLRTAIRAEQRPPVQVEIDGPATVVVEFDQVDAADLDRRLVEERRHRFRPTDWPLIRLQVLRLSPVEHALIVHAHHLLGDGYSVVVLTQDLLALYDEVAAGTVDTLAPLRSTFRSYVALITAQTVAAAESTWERPGPRATRYAPPVLRHADRSQSAPALTTFTLDRPATARLRQLAHDLSVTPYAALLTAYYRSLTTMTDQADLLLGVAVTGRDHSLPDLNRVVGPLATVIPVRLRDLGTSFREQLPRVAEAVLQARTEGATIHQRLEQANGSAGLSAFGTQFLFSYLDFEALGPFAGQQLQLSWDDRGTDLEPPPVGTDLLLTARLADGCLQVTIRASRNVLSASELNRFSTDLQHELAISSTLDRRTPSQVGPQVTSVLDAALIGYLPAPHDVAALVGLPVTEGLRESIRGALFPAGRPRLLEELNTPIGRSGFVCLPVFADELPHAARTTLAADVAAAVGVAGSLGARAVSLAGMIPAHTAYGFDVLAHLGPSAPRLTTGHAATAASVVKTTMRALEESGSRLAERTLTVLGLGSIGWTSLQLLLALDVGVPRGVLLCDVAGRTTHLRELTETLRDQGCPAQFTVCGPDLLAPARVYEADLIVAAINADRPVLDVDRLRPGTIVVDDSFPHCFDPATAIRRMTDRGDVTVVGGGLLTAGPSQHRPADDHTLRPHLRHLTGRRLPDTIASCQLEALMLVEQQELPSVHGLVDAALALTYWQAMAALDITAAPLHLQQQYVTPVAAPLS